MSKVESPAFKSRKLPDSFVAFLPLCRFFSSDSVVHARALTFGGSSDRGLLHRIEGLLALHTGSPQSGALIDRSISALNATPRLERAACLENPLKCSQRAHFLLPNVR